MPRLRRSKSPPSIGPGDASWQDAQADRRIEVEHGAAMSEQGVAQALHDVAGRVEMILQIVGIDLAGSGAPVP